MPRGSRARAPWLVLAPAGVVVALAAWGFTLVSGAFGCTLENSNCARTHSTEELRGRLFDYEGRPAPRTTLLFHSDVYGHGFEAPFVTDGEGRFCVRAVPGPVTAFVVVPNQRYAGTLVVRSTEPVDPRFADPRVREEIRRRSSGYSGPDRLAFVAIEPVAGSVSPPAGSFSLIAAHEAVTLWNGATDSARSCQGVGEPAWYRFTDLESSWQFAVLNVAPAVTLASFVVGVGLRLTRRWRPARGERWFQATCAAAIATVVVTLALWSLL